MVVIVVNASDKVLTVCWGAQTWSYHMRRVNEGQGNGVVGVRMALTLAEVSGKTSLRDV